MNVFKAIVGLSFAIAISACSDNETVQSYIGKAEVLLIENQDKAAIIALKNAIKLDAKNARARFLLGRLYLSSGDAENAVKELERANQFKYDANQVLPLLARAYMLTESDEDIIELAAQGNSLSNASKTQFLAYKTIAALRLGNEVLAKASVESALVISIEDGYSRLASAYLEFANKNIPQASSLVSRILTATPENVDALMLQGQIATVEKNYQLAKESFKQYYVLQPNYGRVQLFIAETLLKNGDVQEAEVIADTILARIPNQPFFQYIKAMARFEDKDYQNASHYAGLSLGSGFNSLSLKLVAGASAFYLKNYQQSNLHLSDLINYLAIEHPARRMLAISQLELGLIDDISETLSGYDASKKENAQFLTNLSYELLAVGALEKAREMANYATSGQEIDAEQTARAGILKLMMNDPTGVENLELALQQNPALISAELALAFASINSGDIARANKIADKWIKAYPEKAGGYNLQAAIAFEQNRIEQGKLALEKSLQIDPNNIYALTGMVKLAYLEKDSNKARLLTEQALSSHPNSIKVLRQYFEFHQDEQGLQAIKSAQQANVDNISYGILLAEAYLQLKQHQQAKEVLSSYSLTAKTPKRYWQLLLIANARQKDDNDSFILLDKWRKNNPYHVEPVFLLVDYYLVKKLPDRALNVIQRSFKQHPNNLMLHLVKMQILLNDSRLADAKSLHIELLQFDINPNLMAGIEGRIFLLEKNYAAAIPKLTQQYEAKPSSRNVVFLAFAYEGNQQKQAGIDLLKTYSDSHGFSPRISLSLANFYLAESSDKAIVEYEKLLNRQDNNVVALNNLSWLYLQQGNVSQALKYSQQAYELAPTLANVVDTYAQALLKSAQVEQALLKAKEAYTLSKAKDMDIVLNYVETLLVNNEKTQAVDLLKKHAPNTDKQKEKHQQLTSQVK